MKVVIYMAVTANGMIAREDNHTDFVSQTEWAAFEAESKRAGNIVIGKKTFDVCRADGTFPFAGRFNVVMTNEKPANPWGDQVLFTDKTPTQVVEMLKRTRADIVFVGGGGTLNAAFLKAGLVDELVLDVMPHVLGKGILLFAPGEFEAKLRLIQTEKLSRDEIRLRYRVEKGKK